MKRIWNTLFDKAYPALLALAGVAGGGILFQGMRRWGIGVYYDSVFYLSAADNLLKGNGMVRLGGDGSLIPLNHYPPLYSLVLALLSWITHQSTTQVAWGLTIVCFAVLIFLTGFCIFSLTHSRLAGIIGSLLILTSPIVVDLHLMAMTEPFFLIFTLASLWLIFKVIRKPSLKGILWAALLTSAAYLTRYVGIVVVAAGFLAMLVFLDLPFWKRVKLAVPYGILSVLLNLAWSVRNLIKTGSATNRLFNFHKFGAEKLSEMNRAMCEWFLPGRLPASLRTILTILVILAAVAISIWLVGKNWKDRQSGTAETDTILFAVLLSLFYVLYKISVVFSLVFFDASTRLNNRILCPIYFTVLIQLVLLVWILVHDRPAILRCVAVAAAVLLMGMYAVDEARLLADYTHNGIGFTGRVWQRSELIQILKKQPISGAVYSNEAFGLYYLLDRPTYSIPQTRDPVTTESLPGTSAAIQQMQNNIRRTDGDLVIFTPYDTGGVYPELDDLIQGLSLSLTAADGEVYTGK